MKVFRILPRNKGWVAHISLVFREMWDTTALDLVFFDGAQELIGAPVPLQFSFHPRESNPPAGPPKMLTSIIEGQHAGKNPTTPTFH
jgi:hypothetical protein